MCYGFSALIFRFMLLFFVAVFSLQGCMDGVEQWLKDNLGVILGVCTGVAIIEVSHFLT